MKKQKHRLQQYSLQIETVLCSVSESQVKFLPFFRPKKGQNIYRFDVVDKVLDVHITYKDFRDDVKQIIPCKNCIFLHAMNENNAIKVINRLVNDIALDIINSGVSIVKAIDEKINKDENLSN